MKKYHPNIVIVRLIIRGLIVFSVSILAGIWIAHGLGKGFEKLGAKSAYFADFLGGALGLTLGFVLDKMCIERISHVLKYKQLMKVVKRELDDIKKNCYEDVSGQYILSTQNEKEMLHVTSKTKKGGDVAGSPTGDLAVDETIDPNKLRSTYLEELREYNPLYPFRMYSEHYPIYEYIFDDLVKNADTMSILANLPLASEYSGELIRQLCLIQKYIEEYTGSKDFQAKKSWLLLQYNINKVIEVL